MLDIYLITHRDMWGTGRSRAERLPTTPRTLDRRCATLCYFTDLVNASAERSYSNSSISDYFRKHFVQIPNNFFRSFKRFGKGDGVPQMLVSSYLLYGPIVFRFCLALSSSSASTTVARNKMSFVIITQITDHNLMYTLEMELNRRVTTYKKEYNANITCDACAKDEPP